MPPKFQRVADNAPAAESPERLFDDLHGTPSSAASLWSHQADLLRAYYESHLDTPDVAFELPTGAGKTLPALLVAEWRRTARAERVVYACPTTQLADQVADAAAAQGVRAVSLHGPSSAWSSADVSKYTGGRAIAISTYSAIFNLKPKLDAPQTLLFDDAHAGEQYVAGAWSVTVDRFDDPDTYGRLLDVIGGELSGLHLQEMRSDDPDYRTRIDVRLLPVDAMRRRSADLANVLRSMKGDQSYRYSMISSGLDRCMMYFGWTGFLIRPFIAPTFQHPHFTEANQRLYISATLGEGGELERAFGRSPITRLPIPAGWDQRGSGRRFFLFPDLVNDVESGSLVKEIIRSARKALIVSPSKRAVDKRLAELVPDGIDVIDAPSVATAIEQFRSASQGVLGLASRYDGIDLADDACRVTVLDGLPTGEHLQERFLVASIRAGRVLEERLRTRVMQGAGRSTRGLKDHSIVVVLGDDITRFLQKQEVLAALRAEAQAEIRFGTMNSEMSQDDVLEIVKSFLDQDDDWHDGAEPMIAEARRQAVRELPPGTAELATSASKEVKAMSQAWRGDYRAASITAVEAAQALTHSSVSSYRALWLYLASAWQHADSQTTGDPATDTSSRELLRRAHGAAQNSTWMRELAPLPAGELVVSEVDDAAIDAIASHQARTMPAAKWAKLSTDTVEALRHTEAEPFERALTTLGSLLGASARKPKGQGRADSVWHFAELLWITLEAKSEKASHNLISMDDVRQANTQLGIEASDAGTETPTGSFSIIVSPRQLAQPDAAAIANDNLYMTTPSDLESLAMDTVEAWRQIRTTTMGTSGNEQRSAIRQILADRRLLVAAVTDRLAEMLVRS